MVPKLSRVSETALINNDLGALKIIKSNNAACARQAGCKK
jgi:hypothetical protein